MEIFAAHLQNAPARHQDNHGLVKAFHIRHSGDGQLVPVLQGYLVRGSNGRGFGVGHGHLPFGIVSLYVYENRAGDIPARVGIGFYTDGFYKKRYICGFTFTK